LNTFAQYETKIKELASLPCWWNGDSDPPNDVAIAHATEYLEDLKKIGLPPSSIKPWIGGGLFFRFVRDGNDADIEFFNNGKIFAAFDVKGSKEIKQIVLPSEKRLILQKFLKIFNSSQMTNNSLEDRIKSSRRRYRDALKNLEAMAQRCWSLGMDDDSIEPSLSIESAAFHLIQESNQLRALLEVEDSIRQSESHEN
jgi:hypothetical protein